MNASIPAPSKLFSAIQSVITTNALPALGPVARKGVKPVSQLRSELDAILTQERVSATVFSLLNAAALLWHDHLDAAHTIVQDAHSAEGAFLHGIMHRREPDYGNAKYWFHRVGRHKTFPTVASRVRELFSARQTRDHSNLVSNDEWQPMNFIDACQAVADRAPGDAGVSLLQEVQQVEFAVLLTHICSMGRSFPA